jgi:hypothetical protein
MQILLLHEKCQPEIPPNSIRRIALYKISGCQFFSSEKNYDCKDWTACKLKGS